MLVANSFDSITGVSETSVFASASMAPVPAAIAPSRVHPVRDDTALETLLRHPGIWRRGTRSAPLGDAQPTGLAELDALLPGGGWPRGALSEILIAHDGIGECSLLLHALAALTQSRKRVVLVAPPYIPYVPAFAAAGVDLAHLVHIDAGVADTHWTAEQCLRAGCCGAVLGWLPNADYRRLRRLQLAAETGATIGFAFRPLSAARETSPAALRLALTPSAHGARIEILKCRGSLRSEAQVLLEQTPGPDLRRIRRLK